MFRRERPPCEGKSPNDRASPPHHTPLQLVSSFCCFPTTVYMLLGSLFISWERCSRPLCTLPLHFVYHLGLCLSTTLPHLLRFTGRVPGTITWYPAHHRLRCVLFTVPTVPLCCPSSSSKIKKLHNTGRDLNFLLITSLLFTWHTVSLLNTCKSVLRLPQEETPLC